MLARENTSRSKKKLSEIRKVQPYSLIKSHHEIK
jgi:hypothetical protein